MRSSLAQIQLPASQHQPGLGSSGYCQGIGNDVEALAAVCVS
jgi:hypothetical protein